MQTIPRALNHKWHRPLLAFYRSWLSSCCQPWLIVFRPAGVWPCQPGWRPYTAFNLGTVPVDHRRRKLPRMISAQVLNLRRGLEMAQSREATASAELTHWGLASLCNHHTVVHWPGSQLGQKRLKINSIQLPANDCHLTVNVFLIHINHLEAEHLLCGSRSFESH